MKTVPQHELSPTLEYLLDEVAVDFVAHPDAHASLVHRADGSTDLCLIIDHQETDRPITNRILRHEIEDLFAEDNEVIAHCRGHRFHLSLKQPLRDSGEFTIRIVRDG